MRSFFPISHSARQYLRIDTASPSDEYDESNRVIPVHLSDDDYMYVLLTVKAMKLTFSRAAHSVSFRENIRNHLNVAYPFIPVSEVTTNHQWILTVSRTLL